MKSSSLGRSQNMPNESAPPESPGQKRIACFWTGPGNTVSDNTNVWRLKALCAERSADGARQVAYYSRGVGTTFGEKVRGGLFGVGIDRNVSAAYEWLIETYERGTRSSSSVSAAGPIRRGALPASLPSAACSSRVRRWGSASSSSGYAGERRSYDLEAPHLGSGG